jgi:hypothetical protein
LLAGQFLTTDPLGSQSTRTSIVLREISGHHDTKSLFRH